VHDELPAAEYLPTPQVLQLVAPSDALSVPAPQSSHDVLGSL